MRSWFLAYSKILSNMSPIKRAEAIAWPPFSLARSGRRLTVYHSVGKDYLFTPWKGKMLRLSLQSCIFLAVFENKQWKCICSIASLLSFPKFSSRLKSLL